MHSLGIILLYTLKAQAYFLIAMLCRNFVRVFVRHADEEHLKQVLNELFQDGKKMMLLILMHHFMIFLIL